MAEVYESGEKFRWTPDGNLANLKMRTQDIHSASAIYILYKRPKARPPKCWYDIIVEEGLEDVFLTLAIHILLSDPEGEIFMKGIDEVAVNDLNLPLFDDHNSAQLTT